ncbi:hypothetical protein [Flavobacterium psychrophilum]|uniref:hypothetical protein n=1 Tax=Flavobacterium psychrophilum TaxID=96345 RepID=UPI00117A9C6A|nr:hypothetical protein [Flavobacterium psychrophilum]
MSDLKKLTNKYLEAAVMPSVFLHNIFQSIKIKIMTLNKKLCKIVDTDEGYDNQELANKIEKLFNKELSKYQQKAMKWDNLHSKIAKCYCDENGDELSEEDSEDIDLGTIGEISASAFGFL